MLSVCCLYFEASPSYLFVEASPSYICCLYVKATPSYVCCLSVESITILYLLSVCRLYVKASPSYINRLYVEASPLTSLLPVDSTIPTATSIVFAAGSAYCTSVSRYISFLPFFHSNRTHISYHQGPYCIHTSARHPKPALLGLFIL